jgi:hypothetical protein
MLALKRKKIRKYIRYVLFVLLILIPILFRYETLQKKETSDYTCKVMIDRWRTGCVFCYEATIDEIERLSAYYVVKRNSKTIFKFQLFPDETHCFIYRKKHATIENDTLFLTAYDGWSNEYTMKIPMDGEIYKVKDIPIKGKYTGGHRDEKPSNKRMEELIKYHIRDY